MIFLIVLSLIFLYVLALYLSTLHKNLDKIFSIFHFFGGLIFAVLFSYFISNGIIIVSLVLFVGLLWELYEYLVNEIDFLKKSFKKYLGIKHTRMVLRDTAYDIVFDVCGALVFVLLSMV